MYNNITLKNVFVTASACDVYENKYIINNSLHPVACSHTSQNKKTRTASGNSSHYCCLYVMY